MNKTPEFFMLQQTGWYIAKVTKVEAEIVGAEVPALRVRLETFKNQRPILHHIFSVELSRLMVQLNFLPTNENVEGFITCILGKSVIIQIEHKEAPNQTFECCRKFIIPINNWEVQ